MDQIQAEKARQGRIAGVEGRLHHGRALGIEMVEIVGIALAAHRDAAAREIVGLLVGGHVILMGQTARQRGIDPVGRLAVADSLHPLEIAVIGVRFAEARRGDRDGLVRCVMGQRVGAVTGDIAARIIGPGLRQIS